jgi:hypothetical protein
VARRNTGPSVTLLTTGCGFSFLFHVAFWAYRPFYIPVKETDFSYVYFSYINVLSESKTFSSKGRMIDEPKNVMRRKTL